MFLVDFTMRDGTGGESIDGGPLQDEGGFKRKHDIEGMQKASLTVHSSPCRPKQSINTTA
jgi:hypothetical protein